MSALTQTASVIGPVTPPMAPAVEPDPALWDEEVLADLLATSYVRAVVFTNGQGRTLRMNRRATAPDALAKVADLALAALTQTGVALKLGRVEVSACVYEDGVVLLSGSQSVRVAVLADGGANLGTLLNHLRRIFPERRAP